MAAPAFGSSGAFVEGSGGTLALPVPAGVAADDIIVCPIYVNGAESITVMPAGFTDAPGSPVALPPGAGQHRQHVVWKRATGADVGTYDFTLSSSVFRVGQASRYTGAKPTGSPWDASSAVADATIGTVTPAVSIVTAGADEMVLWTGTDWSGGSWTPPAGFTERLDAGVGLITMAEKVQAVAGSTGSVQGTSTNADRRTAWLSALLPVPAPEGDEVHLGLVMDAIGNRLKTIAGLRVFSTPPPTITPPAAIVSYPEVIEFDKTYGRGMDVMTLPVVLVVGRVSDRLARDQLGAYCDGSGSKSVKAVIESATYTAFDVVRVERVEFDPVTIGGVDYLAALFTLGIGGKGS